MAPSGRSRRRLAVRRVLTYVCTVGCISAIGIIQCINFQYAGRESPLDHTKTTLLRPLYKLGCASAWNTSAPHHSKAECGRRMPQVFMISARQPIDRLESNISWQAFEQQHDHNRTVQMIDTKNLSAQLEPRVVAECPDHAWAHRLFLIYQTVFEDVLKRFPQESDFVFLEDDALLVDASVFEFEVCRAQVEEHAFFSLYRASRQDSCIYHSGTVAFYITKPVMEEVIRVGTATSCRLPIDIFLATNGPWYATAEDIVRHHSVRTKLIDG